MKPTARIVITGHLGIRLSISLDSFSDHQESRITQKAIQFYKSLSYQFNKEDDLDKCFNKEGNFDIALEDDVESEGIENNIEDEDNYQYNDFKYK